MDRNPQKIKEKFTSKPTGNQTHYHCEAQEIKPKTHLEFTHHLEAHDAGLTTPHHAHADFQPSSDGMLKRSRQRCERGSEIKIKIKIKKKKTKKKKNKQTHKLSVRRSPHHGTPTSNLAPVACLKEEDRKT